MAQTGALTSVNSLMLMLLAFCDSFLRTSSRAKPIFGCTSTGAGRLATEPRGSSEAREPGWHRAAVMVAAGTRKRRPEDSGLDSRHERSTKEQTHTDIFPGDCDGTGTSHWYWVLFYATLVITLTSKTQLTLHTVSTIVYVNVPALAHMAAAFAFAISNNWFLSKRKIDTISSILHATVKHTPVRHRSSLSLFFSCV